MCSSLRIRSAPHEYGDEIGARLGPQRLDLFSLRGLDDSLTSLSLRVLRGTREDRGQRRRSNTVTSAHESNPF
jgi:hypothetical protein